MEATAVEAKEATGDGGDSGRGEGGDREEGYDEGDNGTLGHLMLSSKQSRGWTTQKWWR